jgi:hypothetical protein
MQDDLFGGNNAVPEIPTPDYVRDHMKRIIAQVQNAAAVPLDENTTRTYEIIVPQMANWLPQDEAEALVAEFRSELARFKLAS